MNTAYVYPCERPNCAEATKVFRHAERRPGCWRNLLLAVTGMIAVGLPFALGQSNASQRDQTKTTPDVEPSAQSIGMPDWQKAAGGKMAFEVASVRPSAPGTFRPPTFPLSLDESYLPTGGRFFADFGLDVYVEFAYKLWLTPEQREALFAHFPNWTKADKFTVEARGPADATKDQMRLMMQSLLADRFGLKVHYERRETPVLVMTLARPGKLGPKLRSHSEGPACDEVIPVPTDG